MPFEFIQPPANGEGTAKEELNRLLRGGRIASVRKEFVPNGEDSFWAFFKGHQQRFPICPQLRPQAPEGTGMSSMGLNQSSSRSHPSAGSDKITTRPPGVGSLAHLGSNALGGTLFLANHKAKAPVNQ